MGDQRIDAGAAAATRGDADPGDGQGLQTPGAHPGGVTGGAVGDADDLRTPERERGDVGEPAEGDTEGERAVRGITGRSGAAAGGSAGEAGGSAGEDASGRQR